MDAYVGVDVLGLSFMTGEQPHAGVPEAAYSGMAEKLARAGYRVVVVEQVRAWCFWCLTCAVLLVCCVPLCRCCDHQNTSRKNLNDNHPEKKHTKNTQK